METAKPVLLTTGIIENFRHVFSPLKGKKHTTGHGKICKGITDINSIFFASEGFKFTKFSNNHDFLLKRLDPRSI
jgi:hypothetical protein